MYILPPPCCYSPALGKKTRRSKCSRRGDSLLSLKLWFHDFVLDSFCLPFLIENSIVSFEAPNDPDVSGTHWKDLLSRMLVKHSALRCLLCCGVLSWFFSCHGFLHGRGPGVRRGPVEKSSDLCKHLCQLWNCCTSCNCSLHTKDAETSLWTMHWDNELESLGAIVIVAAQPFAFACLMLENIIISDTWSNIGWHLDSPVLYPPNLCIKSVSYENDLFFTPLQRLNQV